MSQRKETPDEPRLSSGAGVNLHADRHGLGGEVKGSLLSFEQNRTQVGNLDGKVQVGPGGVEVGAGAAIFKSESECGDQSLSIGKAGANFGITGDKGLDVGIEGKAVWKEVESENMKIGVGVNVDTGIKANEDGVDVSILGIGFSAGKDGVGFKLPFLNMKWKK